MFDGTKTTRLSKQKKSFPAFIYLFKSKTSTQRTKFSPVDWEKHSTVTCARVHCQSGVKFTQEQHWPCAGGEQGWPRVDTLAREDFCQAKCSFGTRSGQVEPRPPSRASSQLFTRIAPAARKQWANLFFIGGEGWVPVMPFLLKPQKARIRILFTHGTWLWFVTLVWGQW